MSWCDLEDKGFEGLAEGLADNHSLTDLNVEYICANTEEAAKILERVMGSNGSLMRCFGFSELDDNLHELFERNWKNHYLVRLIDKLLIAVRRFRKTWLNEAPKEVVQIIAKCVLRTRTDLCWTRCVQSCSILWEGLPKEM